MADHIDINEFTYPLTPDRIALFPLEQRDRSRLLFYNKGRIAHQQFNELPGFLQPGTMLVFNDTKVIQARVLFKKESGATIEVFLLHPLKPSTLLLEVMQANGTCSWKCTIGNLKRWKDETVLIHREGHFQLQARLKNREEGIVEFNWDPRYTFAEIIAETGQTPLPPYLKRTITNEDKARYQTIYSAAEGAVAAPTAGLHFTNEVFKALEEKNIIKKFVTLHVSAGTFLPVKERNALQHTMHEEQIVVTLELVQSLRDQLKPIVAVGTTSMRTLESLYWLGVKLLQDDSQEFELNQRDAYTLPQNISRADALNKVIDVMKKKKIQTLVGETSIYIVPGYKFRMTEALITNFHQPASTLILLVAAFIGEDWKKVYEEALENGYRFLSYGDSSLLIS